MTVGLGTCGVSMAERYFTDLHDETGVSYSGEKKSDHLMHDSLFY